MPITACAHHVQFFAADDALSVSVSSFLAVPLLRGEAAVVVATPEHRAVLARQLALSGLDLEALRLEGRYQELDAAQTLRLFMTEAGLEEATFDDVVGGVVRDAIERFGAVSAYGEMVGVLATQGKLVAALQLEGLWCRLMDDVSIRLLCGYPREPFEDADTQDALAAVCAAHDAVAESTARSAVVDLPSGLEAGATARRATRRICAAWCLDEPVWLGDALLVVSELVGNAVRHSSSRVALALEAYDGRFAISVTDGSLGRPVTRVFDTSAEGGRGFAIIDALALGWGVESQPCGKRVWAHLPPGPVMAQAYGDVT